MKAKRRVVTGKAASPSTRGTEQRRGTPSASSPAMRGVERAAAPRPAVSAPPLDGPIDLSVDLGRGLILPNPILVASGTFGYGIEYGEVVDVDALGGICCKGTTLRARVGNPTPRVTETPGGMLNSIGLQNPGVDAVIDKYATTWAGWRVPVIVNVAGESVGDYVEVVASPGRDPGRRRHRAQHLVPERRTRRTPVRDRCGSCRGRHGRSPARDGPAAAREAVAERRRCPADRARHRRCRRRRAHRGQHAVGHRGRRIPRQAAARQHLRRPERSGDQAGRAAGRLRGLPGRRHSR